MRRRVGREGRALLLYATCAYTFAVARPRKRVLFVLTQAPRSRGGGE
jgi:hypothetical protein